MIYGYVSRDINEYGLKQMREVSISASPEALRRIAEFLLETAEELETAPQSVHWHKHSTKELQEAIGCDIILLDSQEKS